MEDQLLTNYWIYHANIREEFVDLAVGNCPAFATHTDLNHSSQRKILLALIKGGQVGTLRLEHKTGS